MYFEEAKMNGLGPLWSERDSTTFGVKNCKKGTQDNAETGRDRIGLISQQKAIEVDAILSYLEARSHMSVFASHSTSISTLIRCT